MTTGKVAKIGVYFQKIYRRVGRVVTVFGVLALLIIISSLISSQFLTAYNITIMARDLGFIGIVAIGQGCYSLWETLIYLLVL